MEEKIKQRCEEVGIDPAVLTDEERKQLAKEIEQEEKGLTVLDGVLSNPTIAFRGFK